MKEAKRFDAQVPGKHADEHEPASGIRASSAPKAAVTPIDFDFDFEQDIDARARASEPPAAPERRNEGRRMKIIRRVLCFLGRHRPRAYEPIDPLTLQATCCDCHAVIVRDLAGGGW